jgi:hypothetical protein
MKKALTYTGGLIALYLVTNNWLGASGVLGSAANGGVSIITALQGRKA